MRKKLFTLMTLLLTAVTGAWATDWTIALSNFTKTGSTYEYTFSQTKLNTYKDGLIYVEVPSASVSGDVSWKADGTNSERNLYIYKTNGTVKDTERPLNYQKGWVTVAYTSSDILTNAGKYYLVFNTQDDWKASGVKYTVPTLEGAWTPTSSTIYVGDAVPTPSFSVTASNSAVLDGSEYSVTYSLKEGSTDGMITIPDGGASYTLNNSEVGTATLIATLVSEAPTTYEVETATYEYEYEVKAKTPAIELTEDEVTLKSTPVTRNASTTVDLTGAFLNDGTGTVTWTAVDGLTIAPTSFDITSGAATETFTISYNKDAAASGSVNVTFSDGTTNKVLTVNYSSVVPHTWGTVSATTEWDWSKLGTTEVKLSDTTNPKKTDEFLLGDLDGDVYDYNIDYTPATFDATKLMVTTEYVVRDKKYFQGNMVKFKTSVPGTLSVDFTNTNGSTSDRPYRYLNVNGTNTEFKSGLGGDANKVSATGIKLPAGEVVIKGNIPDASDPVSRKDDKVGDAMLRIYKIVFTADDGSITQEAVTITCEGGLASYVNYDKDLDFSTSTAKAYIVTATSASSVTLTEVKKVARGTGIIIAGGAKGDVINVLTTDEPTDIVTANHLKATAASTGTTVGANEAYGLSKADGKFHKLNAGTIPAGKAYLPATAFGGGAPEIADLDFNGNSDMTTGISTIEHSTLTIEHSAFYNLSGQRVSQPTKGLYIVNGKKVVIK